MTGINTMDIFLLGLPVFSNLSPATNAASGQAPRHFDLSFYKVNLRIMLLEPGEAQDHALLAQLGDSKEYAF